jgi:hypothetical protein
MFMAIALTLMVIAVVEFSAASMTWSWPLAMSSLRSRSPGTSTACCSSVVLVPVRHFARLDRAKGQCDLAGPRQGSSEPMATIVLHKQVMRAVQRARTRWSLRQLNARPGADNEVRR